MSVPFNLIIRKNFIMKILALDLGDKWIGSALSDQLQMTCKPFQTVELYHLETFLKKVLADEPIDTIVVGYPKTVSSGQESDQTRKVVALKDELSTKFPDKNWVLWDERLSSKRADQLKRATNKEEKIKSHSIAAAFILQNYLDYLAFNR